MTLWVEDFSAVKRLMDDVRARGISNFATFLKVHPEFVDRCMQEIRVVDVNQETLSMFKARDKEALLQNVSKIFRDEMHESFAEQLQDLWKGVTTQQREVVNYSLSGDPINIHMQFAVLPDSLNSWSQVLVSLMDITARKKAEAYLEYLGKHDVLTQLQNRTFYMEELNRLQRKGPWPVSVLAIDLNGLKRVNDEHGHAAGDALLRRAGEVLANAGKNGAVPARIGGDEFAFLLAGADEFDAKSMRDRLVKLIDLNNQFYGGKTGAPAQLRHRHGHLQHGRTTGNGLAEGGQGHVRRQGALLRRNPTAGLPECASTNPACEPSMKTFFRDPVTSPPGKVPSASRALIDVTKRMAREIGLFVRHNLDHPPTLLGGGIAGVAVGGILASMGHGERETNQNIGMVIGLVFSTWFMWRTRSDAVRKQSKV